MTFRKTPELLGLCIAVATAFSTFSVGAISATVAAPAGAEARYQRDRADCLAGRTAEDRKTCLKEAGAALQAARAHQLTSESAARRAANERKRCAPLSGDERTACLAGVDGQGTTTGSVAGGGKLHERVTIVPGVQPEAAASTGAGPATLPPKPND